MANYNPLRLTKAGRILLTKAYAKGVAIKFTKVASGNGRYSEDEDCSEMTGLKSKKQEFAISSIEVVNQENVQLNILLYNYGLDEGYEIREIGLYAYDPEDGEILYAILTAKEGLWDYFPAYSEIRTATISLKLLLHVADATNIVIEVNEELFVPYKVYEAKVKELEERIKTGIGGGSGQSYTLPMADESRLGGVMVDSTISENMNLKIGRDESGHIFTENPTKDISIGLGKDNKTIFLLYKGEKVGNGIEINGGGSSEITVKPSEETETPSPSPGQDETEYTTMNSIASLYANAYFDTGVLYNAKNMSIELEFEIIFDGKQTFMEANGQKARMSCYTTETTGLAVNIGSMSGMIYNSIIKEAKNKLRIDKGIVYLNGALMMDMSKGTVDGNNQGFVTEQTIKCGFCIRTYGMKIWNDDVLTRDLIPVKNPRGELAMYDLVNKKYHCCAGSGSFV